MHWQDAAHKSTSDILDALRSSSSGLSDAEVQRRQKEYGYNQIGQKKIRWWMTLISQFRSSFMYLLLVASALSFLLGERIEAIMMLFFLGINAILGFIQEHRSLKALELLKQYLVTRAHVKRNGEVATIDSKEVVPGDIIVISAGDKIVADIRLIESHSLSVDEEVLTGESVAVEKVASTLSKKMDQMYKAKNIGFGGTVVLRGHGVGVVLSTGGDTAMGEIAHLAETTKRESGFEKGIHKFSRFIMKLVIVTLVLIFLANLLIKGEGANFIELLIFSLVLVISVIPEALPFVITISLSRGSLRLAKKKVVAKRLSAIEDLGSIEVLCSDKTGTLTENKLSVEKVYAEDKKLCMRLALSASDYDSLQKEREVDSFDKALWNFSSINARKLLKASDKVGQIPFDPIRKRNSVLMIESPDKHKLIVRGAPEAILKISANVSAEKRREYHQWMRVQGEDGRRVLAVAYKDMRDKDSYTGYDESKLIFAGLISFVDPIKETTKDAVLEARKLGVAVKIITGDSKEVSGAVAHKIGLIDSPHEVITGEELDRLSYDKQLAAVQKFSVFARVSPQQKFLIIQLLQTTKEVGFLGEGINDAPALKLADVALVVESASDIAREASDVVLLDSSLKVIVDGIREGRSIFANMIKYIKITLTSNFGNFYSVAIASLLIPFVPMLPLQILLIDILSDFPMLALATDAIDDEELREPKSYNVKDIALIATLLGVVSSIFDFILFASFYQKGEAVLQTNWFILSLMTELVLIFSLRTRFAFYKAKRPSAIVSILAISIFIAAAVFPFSHIGESLFHFTRPNAESVLWIAGLAMGYFLATEAVKHLYYSRTKQAV